MLSFKTIHAYLVIGGKTFHADIAFLHIAYRPRSGRNNIGTHSFDLRTTVS